MKQKIFDLLDRLDISYKNFEHQAVHSCSEAKCVDVPGLRLKSLLLKNKKSTNFYMVVFPDSIERLDTNIVRRYFEDSKLSFVDAEKMYELIGVYPGSVSPYALIHNQEKNIKVVFDTSLEGQLVGFHPGKNDNTTVANFSDVKRFLDYLGFSYYFISF